MFSLQETIRPSADLRNHYNVVSKQCRIGAYTVLRNVIMQDILKSKRQEKNDGTNSIN